MDYKKLTKVVDNATPSKYVKLSTGRDGYTINQVENETMTVGEFMQALDEIADEDTPVYFCNDGGYTYGSTEDCVKGSSKYVVLDTTVDGYAVDQVGDTWTVGELENELLSYSEDALILFRNDRGYTYGYLDDSRINLGEVKQYQENEDEMGGADVKMDALAEHYDFTWYGGEASKRSQGNKVFYTIEKFGLEDEMEELQQHLENDFATDGKVTIKPKDNSHFDLVLEKF